jgi:transposase
MVKPVSGDGKAEVLAGSRTLNPHPGAVTDAVFEGEDFFDARDLVQVKYEMVRKTDVEDVPVAVAAAAFGFSRQSLYTARAALREQGLAGLVPARPGPKAGHKLTEPVVDHLEALVTADPSTRPVDLVVVVAQRFGVVVHPRSIGRALARRAEARVRQGAPKTS